MAKVTFKQSNVTADWSDADGSLLELGESKGIDLPFGCRQGNCTACQQPISDGKVTYLHEHGGEPDEGNALLCCCKPAGDVVIDA